MTPECFFAKKGCVPNMENLIKNRKIQPQIKGVHYMLEYTAFLGQ